MKDYTWEENPNWNDLKEIAQEDMVHLKFTDSFKYLVKVIVKSVSESEVVGISEAVFDYDTKMPITDGDVLELVDKELSFKKKFIQKIIKKA